MPALTTFAAAPIRVELPPSVAPNIIATNTGNVAAGQDILNDDFLPGAELGIAPVFA